MSHLYRLMVKYKASSISDNFQTPPEALNPLIPFLQKDWIIWECACGKGNLVNELRKNGFKVKASDIKETTEMANKIELFDFLDYSNTVNDDFDCIITNPPFSKKNEFIEKCYEINKPFALLLPLTTLETQERQRQWKKGLQLLILNKRLHFETPNNKKSRCWFSSAWFTYKLNLPRDLLFGEI